MCRTLKGTGIYHKKINNVKLIYEETGCFLTCRELQRQKHAGFFMPDKIIFRISDLLILQIQYIVVKLLQVKIYYLNIRINMQKG